MQNSEWWWLCIEDTVQCANNNGGKSLGFPMAFSALSHKVNACLLGDPKNHQQTNTLFSTALIATEVHTVNTIIPSIRYLVLILHREIISE